MADIIPEQTPSLLVVILDTNPAAWSLLSDSLTISNAVASLLVFINAHLACNYTNKVAVLASHCDSAKWLFPSSAEQHAPRNSREKRRADEEDDVADRQIADSAKKLKINGPEGSASTGLKLKFKQKQPQTSPSSTASNKFRQFRLVEEELVRNLTNLLTSTSPSTITNSASTKVAGALTLALSFINREKITYSESTGSSTLDQTSTADPSSKSSPTTSLQSRIFLLSISPSTDLAHQYIPIMNSIFACQRLSIPIDICQIPLPNTPSTSTVFLQQASDATKGIYIPLRFPSPSQKPTSTTNPPSHLLLLQYLLTAFLPPTSTRTHLILPTRIDVDFRAACFCHRNVVDIGFVCSICLSIFCAPPPDGTCLTCSTHLQLGDYGGRPIVVSRKKKKRRDRLGGGSGVGTPTPGPT